MAERYVDYDKSFQRTVTGLGGNRPSLLLHACCGPCSCYPLTELVPHFRVSILYDNPNIFPADEFKRREKELEKLLVDLKRDKGWDIPLFVGSYDHDSYMEGLREYPDEKEGGRRCQLCYEKRLRAGFHFAKEHGFEYFTTTLTLSRFKPSQVINRIAGEIAKEYPEVTYLFSDFKKRGGIDKGKLIQREYGLYQQLYCGCEYSYEDGVKRAEKLGLDDLYHPI